MTKAGSASSTMYGDPVRRVAQIDRQIRRAGLHHGVHGDQQVDRARQRQADDLLRADTFADQVVRKFVGPAVQLGIGHLGAVVAQRDRVRRTAYLGFEKIRERATVERDGGLVPVDQDLAALVGGDQLDLADRQSGLGDDALEEADEPGLVAVQVVAVVPVGAAVDVDPQAGAVVVHGDGQVVDRTVREVVQGGPVAAEPQVVVEGHHVEHRTGDAAAVGGQTEVVPDVFLAVPLVLEGRAQRLGDDRDQLGHALPRRHGDAQRHVVGQHAGGRQRQRRSTGSDGQSEDQIGESGDAVQVRRGDCDRPDRPVRTGFACRLPQAGRVVSRQRT